MNTKFDFIDKKLLIIIFILLTGKLSFAQKNNNVNSFKLAIPQIFTDVKDFHEGLAAVKIDHKWGFIDKTGKIVIEPQFNPWQAQFNSNFSDGLVAINVNSGKQDKDEIDGNNVNNLRWGFIDKTGKVVIPPIFMGTYSRPPSFSEGLSAVMSESMFPSNDMLIEVGAKYSYINKNGEFVIDKKFDRAYDFKNGLAIVGINGKYGMINKYGDLVIPAIYDTLAEFSEDLSVASVDEKYFLINKSGERISGKYYENLYSFSEGLAAFVENKKLGFIDKNESIIIKPIFPFDSFNSLFLGYKFSENLCPIEFGYDSSRGVFSSGKFGYIDKSGKLVINPKYDYASDFKSGKAIVKIGNDSFFINKNGEKISQNFTNLSNESDGYVRTCSMDILNYKCGFIKY